MSLRNRLVMSPMETMYGTPDGLRRLAAALVVAADDAETLAGRGTPPRLAAVGEVA